MKRLLLLINCILICMIMACCTSKNKQMQADGEANKTEESNRGIEHNAPDQAKIDSIKAAKLELRKTKEGK